MKRVGCSGPVNGIAAGLCHRVAKSQPPDWTAIQTTVQSPYTHQLAGLFDYSDCNLVSQVPHNPHYH